MSDAPDTAHSVFISDHPYTAPDDPNRFLCAVCNLAESTHAETEKPYEPSSKKKRNLLVSFYQGPFYLGWAYYRAS